MLSTLYCNNRVIEQLHIVEGIQRKKLKEIIKAEGSSIKLAGHMQVTSITHNPPRWKTGHFESMLDNIVALIQVANKDVVPYC